MNSRYLFHSIFDFFTVECINGWTETLRVCLKAVRNNQLNRFSQEKSNLGKAEQVNNLVWSLIEPTDIKKLSKEAMKIK